MIDKIPSYFRQPQINDLYMTKPSSIFSFFFFLSTGTQTLTVKLCN